MKPITSLLIEKMPFCLGAMPTPSNPNCLPDFYPFCLGINHKLIRVEQADNCKLTWLLNQAYMVGTEIGTPSDSTELGDPYVNDFINFIKKYTLVGGKLLEIGAGTGYLSRVLQDMGWRVTSIEPGKGYEAHWEMHGVSVINDFFPSSRVVGKFDVIVLYTVLEHIKDTQSFLRNLGNQLSPGGKIFIGVPDCSMELCSGDPSMLLHEHYQYFTATSLANTLLDGGFNSKIEQSKYGRSLFAVATSKSSYSSDAEIFFDQNELCMMKSYFEKVITNIKILKRKLIEWSEFGTVGIYCPSRALNYLPFGCCWRFYDDAPHNHGKYYPPFSNTVLSREQLYRDPPNILFVASITFGEKIKLELKHNELPSKLFLLGEIIL